MYGNENILYFDEDFGNVVFTCNEMGTLKILIVLTLTMKLFDEDDSGTIINVRLLGWHTKFGKRKASNEELMPVAWHPSRW